MRASEAEPIAKGIYAFFDYKRPELGICSNVYLLEGSGGYLMIDSGNGLLELPEPKLVLLTHAHPDHTGGVRGGWQCKLHGDDFRSEFVYKVPKNAQKLLEGTVEFGNFELEIIHTPGHTPGSICLLEKKTKILFSGDTRFAGGGYGRTDLPGGSMNKIIESLRKIDSLEYKMLCPGHGPMEERV